jgi:sugar phosphate isomerase/epimerase
LGKEQLGDSLETVSKALKTADLTAVMEINIHLYDNGLTAEGQTPLDILQANVPAISALPCPLVHWHLVSLGSIEEDVIGRLENSLLPQFRAAVVLARKFGFQFGFEHNEPALMLFADPESCLETLRHVPGLGFVWDFNHVSPEKLTQFQALIPWMSMLHVSDTPLPEVNYHLPLGLGTVDLEANCRALLQDGFSGPAILEIGGLPKSGGFGRDTDEALIDSRKRLETAIQNATESAATG